MTPALFDGSRPMSKRSYWAGWRRILERPGLPDCGTPAVGRRAATDAAVPPSVSRTQETPWNHILVRGGNYPIIVDLALERLPCLADPFGRRSIRCLQA